MPTNHHPADRRAVCRGHTKHPAAAARAARPRACLRLVGCSACERDLLLTCLRLVLTLNFCHFNDKVFYQILGFATGVTCGAEAADLYLHELLALAAAAELYSTSTVLQGEITEITAGPTNVTATRLGVGRVS